MSDTDCLMVALGALRFATDSDDPPPGGWLLSLHSLDGWDDTAADETSTVPHPSGDGDVSGVPRAGKRPITLTGFIVGTTAVGPGSPAAGADAIRRHSRSTLRVAEASGLAREADVRITQLQVTRVPGAPRLARFTLSLVADDPVRYCSAMSLGGVGAIALRRNLIPNPSFEVDAVGSKSETVTVARTPSALRVFAGRYAAVCTVGAGATTATYVGQWVDCLPGEAVAATLRAQPGYGPGWLRFQLLAYSGTTYLGVVARSEIIEGAGGAYTSWTGGGVAPAGTTRVLAAAYVYGSAAGAAPVEGSIMVLDGWIAGRGSTLSEAYEQLGANGDALSLWAAARDDGAAQVYVMGDSISEGTGASTASNRWVTVLQQSLAPSGPSWPFIAAWPNTPVAGWPVARTGSVRRSDPISNRWGPGWRTAEIFDTDGEVVFSFTGTSCRVMYGVASGTGVMSVQVDGGTPVVVDTNAAANGGTSSYGATWKSPPLADGPHTVVVRRHTSSTAGRSVWCSGLLTYRGDEVSGLRVIDGSRHGLNSTGLYDNLRLEGALGTGTVPGAWQGVGGADLLIWGLGTNDYGNNIPEQEFGDNVRGFIAAMRARGIGAPVLLLGMYLGAGRDAARWGRYHAQLQAVAADTPMVSYLDLRQHMPAVPTPAGDPAGLGYYADGLHPSDAGHARIAEVVGGALADAVAAASAYFDGSTPSEDEGRLRTWEGEPHASVSVEASVAESGPVPLAAGVMVIPNRGDVTAWPLIELTGTHNALTITHPGGTFTFPALASGTRIIDCRNGVVWNGSTRVLGASGAWPKVPAGGGSWTVSGLGAGSATLRRFEAWS